MRRGGREEEERVIGKRGGEDEREKRNGPLFRVRGSPVALPPVSSERRGASRGYDITLPRAELGSIKRRLI